VWRRSGITVIGWPIGRDNQIDAVAFALHWVQATIYDRFGRPALID
jgi:hypothetical protein